MGQCSSTKSNSITDFSLSPLSLSRKKNESKMVQPIQPTEALTSDVNDSTEENNLENYFQQFRNEIIGIDLCVPSVIVPAEKMKVVYVDWTASGRMYRPIEEKIINEIGPFCANTHSETTDLGSLMTLAYIEAQQSLKKHVNASNDGKN